MTPKEKPEELIYKFYSKTDEERLVVNKYWSNAKYCALIAVDEILKSNPIQPLSFMLESEALDAGQDYWKEVKQEIEKL